MAQYSIGMKRWITDIEMYLAVSKVVSTGAIRGLQRIRGAWRIYVDTQEERVDLLTTGIVLRGVGIGLTDLSPRRKDHTGDLRISVRDVPLSADDSIIERALTLKGCELTDTVQRERLRIMNRATNCENGTRIIWVKPLDDPLPRVMEMGIYRARVYHRDQASSAARPGVTCAKCGEEGHYKTSCLKGWKCRACSEFGHKEAECPSFFGEGQEPEKQPAEQNSEAEEELESTLDGAWGGAEQTQAPTDTEDIVTDILEQELAEAGAADSEEMSGVTPQTQSSSQSTETARDIVKVKAKKTKPAKGATGSGDITKYLEPAGTPKSGAWSNQEKIALVKSPPTPAEKLNTDSKRAKDNDGKNTGSGHRP